MELVHHHMVDILRTAGVLPVFYHTDQKLALETVNAVYRSGCRVFEFSCVNNESLGIFKELKYYSRQWDIFALGAGSVINRDQARKLIESGADFIVSPIMDYGIAEECKRWDIPWIPGCGTVTEAVKAWQTGASIVSIYPAHCLGPFFLQSIQRVMPEIRMMPGGGIIPDKVNLSKWYDAGAFAVELGSGLFKKELLRKGNIAHLEIYLRNTLALINGLRSLN